MNMRNQLEDGYPKLLRIEPENENKQHHHDQRERRYNSAQQHINPSVPATHMSAPGLPPQPGNSSGFGKGASRSSVPEHQYGAAKGAVRYNYGYEQQPYQASQNRNSDPIKRTSTSTSGSANFYLGGRTSSFGPSGCNAIQKQYSFGSYSAGNSTAANLLSNEESKA